MGESSPRGGGAKRIAVCNQKGGVGKTTSAINLASALALQGVRTLLVDLDPQANATGGLGIDKRSVARSVYHLIIGQEPLDGIVLQTPIANLSIAPSETALSGAEIELVGMERREFRLREGLASATGNYELVIIDSPPSLGLLTVNALAASESVLIPLQCEYYALEGLGQLLETIRRVKAALNPRLSIEGVLLTMADFRTKLTNDVIEEVRRFFGPKVFEVVIPRSVRLSEAPSRGLPIALYDPNCTGAQAYRSLAMKIKEGVDARDAGIRERDPGADPGGASDDSGWSDESAPVADTAEPVPAPEKSG